MADEIIVTIENNESKTFYLFASTLIKCSLLYCIYNRHMHVPVCESLLKNADDIKVSEKKMNLCKQEPQTCQLKEAEVTSTRH